MLLPLTSDPPSTIAADLETAEKKIFAKESLLSARVEGKDGGYDTDMEGASTHFPELESLPSSELFPPIQRFKKDDLKIDPPLTPPTHLPSLPKTVTFSEHVEEMLLDMDYSGELSRAVSRNDEEQEKATGKEIERQLFLDEELLAILEQEAAKAEQKINNEQLQDAATTKKYQVPTLDFTLPQLPWKTGLKSSRDVVKCQRDTILKAVDGANLPTDEHGLRSLERKLRWMPFPSNLGRVALDEQLGTDRDLTQFMYNDERESISVDALASRRPKLKCLESDDEDEDDELGPATFPAPEKLEDIFSLLRKRKLDSDLSNRSGTNGDNEESGGPGMMGHLFSATNALDNFMEVRGKKKPKLTDSGYFVAPQAVMAVPAGPTPPIIPKPNTPAKILKSQPQPIQLPSTNPPPGETTFIISVELMKLRPIIRQIGTLYPSAKLIERDFSRHNKSAWNRGSVARSPVISSLDAEADIIFSPSTGAIVTSFAKVKQKPLPGQKSQVAIRARIEAACKRYESLLVLISEGNSDESSRGLNGQDCIALTDFIGYCGSLPTSTTAVFVPGGKQSLATWITATMIQHGVHGGSVNCLIEVETVWELFLRRCGMNAYAAQTVMGALKAPEGVNTDSPSKAGLFGLPGFVRMDHRERCRRFEAMLGGTAVLKRVSAMIDTSWRPYTPLMGPNKDLMPHFQDASSGMY